VCITGDRLAARVAKWLAGSPGNETLRIVQTRETLVQSVTLAREGRPSRSETTQSAYLLYMFIHLHVLCVVLMDGWCVVNLCDGKGLCGRRDICVNVNCMCCLWEGRESHRLTAIPEHICILACIARIVAE